MAKRQNKIKNKQKLLPLPPPKKKKKKSLWYENYFMLKTVKAQKTQEETLTFPFNGLKEFKMEDPVLE